MSTLEQSDSGDWLSTLDAVSGEARDRIRLKLIDQYNLLFAVGHKFATLQIRFYEYHYQTAAVTPMNLLAMPIVVIHLFLS